MKQFIVLVLSICIFIPHSFAEIALEDLGLSEKIALSSTDLKIQEQLSQRTQMLKTHEILGLTTWGLMTATMLTGGSALDSDTHRNLGIATGIMYFATAYYSLNAPKPVATKDKWRMKWHKGLAWVHLPLMILVPYLGLMYKRNEEKGRGHSALEKQHATYAGILYGTFTLSAALMVIEF